MLRLQGDVPDAVGHEPGEGSQRTRDRDRMSPVTPEKIPGPSWVPLRCTSGTRPTVSFSLGTRVTDHEN